MIEIISFPSNLLPLYIFIVLLFHSSLWHANADCLQWITLPEGNSSEMKAINESCSLKILRLSTQAVNNSSSGHITNLLANDANKIEFAHYFFNHLWVRIEKLIIELIHYLITTGRTSANHSGCYSLLEFRQIYHICRHWLYALSAVSTTVI